VTVAIEAEVLKGKAIAAPYVIYVRTPVQLIQVVEQEPAAIGFAQLALVKQRSVPEVTTDRPLEQTLSLVTLGEPTAATRALIQATRRIAARAM
jgi:hypothetical protein